MTTPPQPPSQPDPSRPEASATPGGDDRALIPGAQATEAIETVPPPGAPFSGPHPKTFWERADRRWDLRAQGRDFIIIAVMIFVYLVWVGIVYFFEPGIR